MYTASSWPELLKQNRLAAAGCRSSPVSKLGTSWFRLLCPLWSLEGGVLENENDSPTSRTMSAALLRILLLLFLKRNCSVFQGLTLPFICADHYRILSYPSVIFYTGLWYCQRAAVNVREMSISRREKQHHRRSKAVLAPRAVNSVPSTL